MASNYIAKGLKRTALAAALGLCFAGGVQAQSTSGDIIGNVPAASGSKVTLKSNTSGVTREYPIDAQGRFRIQSLPIGSYELTLPDGTVSRVNVVAGQAVSANFGQATADANTLDTVTVLGTSLNSIDLTSTETRTTFTAEQLNTLPVARDVTSVSLLTPGTARSSSYFDNASFGGASAAENSYYINGFNVTNLYDNLSFTEVPYQAIGQLDVQTGGYGARYGLSTGGVTSVNVKQGTNEWKGGASYTITPNQFREQPDPVMADNGTVFRTYDNNESQSSVASFWAGGPLIKDKLFVFALASYSDSDSTSFGARGTGYSSGYGSSYTGSRNSSGSDYDATQPYWLLKLDWYINDNNHVEYTGFDNTTRSHYTNYSALYSDLTKDATVKRNVDRGEDFFENGGHTDILKWTSYLTDNLTLSAQYGRMENTNSNWQVNTKGVTNTYDGNVNSSPACPYVLDYRSTSSNYGGTMGCATGAGIGIYDGYNKRDSARIDLEWQLGDHKLALGYNDERWKSLQGNSDERYYVADEDGYFGSDVDGSGTNDLMFMHYKFATGGTVEVNQKSWYVEDSWQVTDNFLLYMGLRNDSFENKNGSGATFVKQDNIWQPRLGFTWDISGDGSSKLYATAGRYSLPIAANVSLRAASASYYVIDFQTFDGTLDPVTKVPTSTGSYAGGALDQIINGENGSTPDPRAVASAGLKPYSADEFILGYQKTIGSENSFLDGWLLGIKGTYRKVRTAIDDTCDTNAIWKVAKASGLDLSNWFGGTINGVDYDGNSYGGWDGANNMPGCFMYNPGSDLNVTFDVDADGDLDNIVVPASMLGPKAKRNYKSVTLSADKSTETWSVSASYTWSKLDGNLEGLVKSTNGQDDTGTTSDFDFDALMKGADGKLFNDHTHSFKVYGGYKFSKEWEVGFNLLAQSGSPISCLGGGKGSFGVNYSYTGVFHVCDDGSVHTGNNRADDDKVSQVGSYGRTPWQITFSPNVIYRPTWAKGLSMQVTVNNLFNKLVATQVYETNFSYSGATYRDYHNFGAPKYFNTPRYVRFQVQYDF